ncbi:MAG: carbohydrate-binding protein [Tunicatimonas sp.]
MIHRLLLAFIILSTSVSPLFAQVPAFPGAEGGGAVSQGGRGGKIIEVTNLNDSGPGSLRAACEASGPRTVVFRVGGTINLKSAIRVFYSYLTVAGQTAPGDGIQIIGPDSKEDLFLVWEAHDIIIRYLRFRHGFTNSVKVQAGGCYNGGNGSYNVIIDHCSFQWGMNDLAGAWSEDKRVHNYTFSNNIFAEALKVHSTNLIFGSNTNAEEIVNMDIHHNFFGNSSHRSPLFKGKSCRVINNIMYNPGWYATGIAGGVTIDIIGNEYKQGPTDMASGRNEVAWRSDYDGPNSGPSGPPSIYIAENKGWSVSSPADNNWSMIEKCAVWDPSNELLNQSFRRNSPQEGSGPSVSIQNVNTLASQLVNHVGASQRLDASGEWIFTRDVVDQRIIKDYQQNTGFIPNHEDEVGGFPVLNGGTPYPDEDRDGMSDVWEAAYGFDQNDAADGNQDADGDGYTNVEEFLNGTTPGSVSPPTDATVYQAEDAAYNPGSVDTQHEGYTGSGYVNTDNQVGSYVEWTVSVSEKATYPIEVTYANGASQNRDMGVSANGQTVHQSVDFSATGSWKNWQVTSFNVPLSVGSNKIRLTSNTSSGASNLDKLAVGEASATDPASGTTTIYTIRARGLQGTEEMALLIGGETVQSWTVSKSLQNYSYTGGESGSVHVAITNDQGVNHDLVVNKLTVDGTVYQAEAQAVNTGVWQKGSCGGTKSEWLHCSGYIEFDLNSANARQANLKQKPVLNQTSSEVLIYPNPSATGSFVVAGATEDSQVEMHDLQGKSIVLNQILDQQLLRVRPRKRLSTGLYIVRVQEAGASTQYKLAVK